MRCVQQTPAAGGKGGGVRLPPAGPARPGRWARFWEALRRSLGAICC